MNANHEHNAGETGNSPVREYLDFEKPLAAIQGQIAELKDYRNVEGIDFTPEIRRLEEELARKTSRIYKNLTAWETVQVARHPQRPVLRDYLEQLCQDFCELHGDRTFADDPAILTGLGRIEREKVMLVGHNKGHSIKEKTACHFGCAHPEGYRKALGKMKLAEKFHLPIVCLIDTPGAYPGIGAEERGQAQAIAQSLMEMFRLRVPILCLVIGEGGSGGALGIGIGDQTAMLQYAYYSVISPEGCASILWKDKTRAPDAAAALKLTAPEVIKQKVIDEIIAEPLGGAHRNPRETIHNVKGYIMEKLRNVREYDIETLLEKRYQKFRTLGEFKIQNAQSGKTEVEIALSEIQKIAQCTTP